MHTFEYSQVNGPYDEDPQGSTTYVYIHHNGDFSGDVRIIKKIIRLEGETTKISDPYEEIIIPFEALKRFVSVHVSDREIRKIEDMSVDELLTKFPINEEQNGQ